MRAPNFFPPLPMALTCQDEYPSLSQITRPTTTSRRPQVLMESSGLHRNLVSPVARKIYDGILLQTLHGTHDTSELTFPDNKEIMSVLFPAVTLPSTPPPTPTYIRGTASAGPHTVQVNTTVSHLPVRPMRSAGVKRQRVSGTVDQSKHTTCDLALAHLPARLPVASLIQKCS